jgi:hypothetical protein
LADCSKSLDIAYINKQGERMNSTDVFTLEQLQALPNTENDPVEVMTLAEFEELVEMLIVEIIQDEFSSLIHNENKTQELAASCKFAITQIGVVFDDVSGDIGNGVCFVSSDKITWHALYFYPY